MTARSELQGLSAIERSWYLTAQKLDMLGRLLGSVRLLDMVLTDDRQVQWYAEQFFKGNYTFKILGDGNAR